VSFGICFLGVVCRWLPGRLIVGGGFERLQRLLVASTQMIMELGLGGELGLAAQAPCLDAYESGILLLKDTGLI